MPRHNAPEALHRRVVKLAASNARYKRRVKKLRGLLDERTERLQDLWGTLQDVQREVGRVWPTGEPGDWDTLLTALKALTQDYVDREQFVHKLDIRNALLREELERILKPKPPWWARAWRKLRRRP